MAIQKHIKILVQLVIVALVFGIANGHGIKKGFYQKTCPRAEGIVKRTTTNHIYRAPSLAAALLRMHFHDWMRWFCAINSTKNNVAVKDGIPNLSIRGFQVIDAAKTAVEAACPGVVSCSDILALARDAIRSTGRRDGRVSIASETLTQLPAPFANITQLKANFASKGLSVKDLAVLSGGHTVGVSHCSTIATRLYNFTGKGDTDPALDSKYIPKLKSICFPTTKPHFFQWIQAVQNHSMPITTVLS
ncbi:hypothetical protein LXL04_019781 [Taraxacum kok-saghyz]